jgi:hypothetical protein
MKNMLTAVLTVAATWTLLACAALAVTQSADTLAQTDATDFKYVEDSSSATVTLIPAISGRTVTLYKFTLSASTADNFYLKCGTTQKTGRIYLGANSGVDSTIYPLYIRCASGESLSLVKGSASTPVGMSLWFNQEP